MSLLKELKEKNAIHDCSNFDELSKFLEENKTSIKFKIWKKMIRAALCEELK